MSLEHVFNKSKKNLLKNEQLPLSIVYTGNTCISSVYLFVNIRNRDTLSKVSHQSVTAVAHQRNLLLL